MYGDAISRDMNSLLYSSTFKHPSDGEFANIKQLISSDAYPNYDQNQDQQQEHEIRGQNQSPLLRYRSSPSSFFSNLLNDDGCEDFADHVAASLNQEPQEVFFLKQQQQQKESESDSRGFLQYESSSATALKQESKEAVIQKPEFSPPSTAPIHGCISRRPNLLLCNNSSGYNDTDHNNLEGSSSLRSMDATSSNFIRQSSVPAGFLSSLTVENGFAGMKDVRQGSSSSRLNNRISFSSGSSSSSRFLPQIPENGSDQLHNSTFNSLKRTKEGDLKMLQINGDPGNHTPSLVHHMSLPKTSSEMAAVENFLQFQQESSVPWKTRAKRGFATHPRSIAERVRRTRISERIKRLQELFPDLDKQTNTADMLDMAVDYIKDLQKELQILNDTRARCTCSSKQLHSGSTM